MNKLAKLYVAYYPIIALSGIMLINCIGLSNYEYYKQNAFWLNCMLGLSFLSVLRDLAMLELFKFCQISKYAVYSMIIFVPVYLILFSIFGYEPKGNLIFQLFIGCIAMVLTLMFYTKKYPNCTMTNYIKAKQYSISIWNCFLKSLAKNNFECNDALEDYKQKRSKYHGERIN
jgi:hypothetical protein